MAAPEPPNWQPPSRRQQRLAAAPADPAMDSRAERNRQRRERSMERRVTWLFAVAVAATTLYLLSRTAWGISLIHAHF